MEWSSGSPEPVLSLEEPCLNLGIDRASKQVSRADVLQAGPWAPLSALFSNPVEDHLLCAGKLLKLTRSVLEGTRGRESLTLKKWFRELETSKMQIAAEMQNRRCFYKNSNQIAVVVPIQLQHTEGIRLKTILTTSRTNQHFIHRVLSL